MTTQENCSRKLTKKNSNNYLANQSEYLRMQLNKKRSSNNIGFGAPMQFTQREPIQLKDVEVGGLDFEKLIKEDQGLSGDESAGDDDFNEKVTSIATNFTGRKSKIQTMHSKNAFVCGTPGQTRLNSNEFRCDILPYPQNSGH